MWATVEGCGEIIKKEWDGQYNGFNAFRLVQKLKESGRLQKEWNKEVLPNNRILIGELMGKIEETQNGEDMIKRHYKNLHLQLWTFLWLNV